ncbi:molybdate transporter subunit; periplasmic-binding component of ABC superfamily [Sphingomonas sp. EC-HK361]|uniref:molybdate ABC transporter substrate-binding protein n=1 Tax=Sphingomonas sp. EC-HK361 TaxID=2038397 RepID=UPI0012536046|nr:molybdate ABC transporter substrate-binding protein [Sphingomonas sp. EC-HK361]VVT12929.1 molybdate transporter subunit; periplasmic-binding component of ABC superfamily [Sphingomonas sp. EC-HK361]
MRRLIRSIILAFTILTAGAASAKPRPPLVLAAASMQESLNDAADAWAKTGHPRPTLSFAASSALARQIMAGGAADLFVSADEDWMNAVAAKGRIVPGTRATLARNRLVIVSAAGRKVRVPASGVALGRALSAGPLAMADPASVPAGKYGEAALRRLGAWPIVAPHVVRAENVRAALALVERGAAPFGVVYATDALASPKVRVAGIFPTRSHAPIVYPVARLKAGTSADAEGFRRFLLSHAGQAILKRRGFQSR